MTDAQLDSPPLKGELMLEFLRQFLGSAAKSKCPECEGKRQFQIRGETRSDRPETREALAACPRCQGKGFIDKENLRWMDVGNQIKQYRVDRGMTQTEFAHRYGGLKTRELVALESGYRNPDQFVEFLSQRGISIEPAKGKTAKR